MGANGEISVNGQTAEPVPKGIAPAASNERDDR